MRKPQTTILKNKIKVLTIQNPNLHSINIGFYFKAGIAYETHHKNGITHLCEHMFFRRLNNIVQKDLYFQMEKIGTTMRAKTYSNFVCFDMTISQNFFDDALNIITQLLSNFDWNECELYKELEIVKKQIEFTSNSFSQFVDENYFSGTKLKMPIMGTLSSVEKISLDQINKWKKQFFNSNNVFCVLTGGFSNNNHQTFLQHLEMVENSVFTIPEIGIIKPKSFCCRNCLSDVIVNTEWDISDISITFDINIEEINIYCVDILCSILGEGVGSKLSLPLREEMALTDEIYSKVDVFPNTRRITIEFSVNNNDLEQSLDICFSEIIKFKDTLTLDDLKSAVVFFTENQRFIFDSPRDYNFYLGFNEFVLNKNSNIETEIKSYNNITLQDLIATSKKVFTSNNLILTITNNREYCETIKIKKMIREFRNDLGES